MNQTIKTTKTAKKCLRCEGTGTVEKWMSHHNGVCYLCNGTGSVMRTETVIEEMPAIHEKAFRLYVKLCDAHHKAEVLGDAKEANRIGERMDNGLSWMVANGYEGTELLQMARMNNANQIIKELEKVGV